MIDQAVRCGSEGAREGKPGAAEARARFPRLAPVIDYLASLRERANLAVLADLLERTRADRADVHGACVFGARGYRRNTICESAWFELLALCWRSGDCTPIHDHQGVSCAFKVIEGEGTEIRFAPTPSGLICPVGSVRMRPGYVCAAADADIHQVANMQAPGRDLITLHIYSPPITRMNTYEYAQPVSEHCADAYAGPARQAGPSACATARPGLPC